MERLPCDHPEFVVYAEVTRLVDTDDGPMVGLRLDVRVECAECHLRFPFFRRPLRRRPLDARTVRHPGRHHPQRPVDYQHAARGAAPCDVGGDLMRTPNPTIPSNTRLRNEYVAGATVHELAARYRLTVPELLEKLLAGDGVTPLLPAPPAPPRRPAPRATPRSRRRVQRTPAPRPVRNLADPANYPPGFVSRGVIH